MGTESANAVKADNSFGDKFFFVMSNECTELPLAKPIKQTYSQRLLQW